jgi:HSP20 family molecular chaperone IbpA
MLTGWRDFDGALRTLDTLRTLDLLHRRIDRAFEDWPWPGARDAARRTVAGSVATAWPPTNVFETKEAFVVKAEVPGVADRRNVMSNVTTVREGNGTAPASAAKATARAIAPLFDVFENADELLIVADVPGVQSGGIDLRVEKDTLLLVARRAVRAEGAPGPALAREYDDVDFATRLRIPAGIDAAAVTAETRNGTLTVRLPKAAAAKPRKIAVRSSAS